MMVKKILVYQVLTILYFLRNPRTAVPLEFGYLSLGTHCGTWNAGRGRKRGKLGRRFRKGKEKMGLLDVGRIFLCTKITPVTYGEGSLRPCSQSRT